MDPFEPAAPFAFVSTHLDDVGLSCSHTVAANPGTPVVTVFAGAPDVIRNAGWNFTTTGLASAIDAITLRRGEDERAMSLLGAEPVWLELFDAEYVDGPQNEDILALVLRQVALDRGLASMVAPLGMFHPDHLAVSNAALRLAVIRDVTLYLYADMPYAQTYPGLVDPRLAEVGRVAAEHGASVEVVPLEPVIPTSGIKAEVVEAYASQLGPVRDGLAGFEASLTAPEPFWRVDVT